MKTILVQQLLDEHAPALMRQCLIKALQGDGPLLRMLVGAKLPRPQDPPLKLGRISVGTIPELVQAHETVMKKVASGAITPVQGQQLDSLLDSHRRFLETQVLAKRVEALEQAQTSQAVYLR